MHYKCLIFLISGTMEALQGLMSACRTAETDKVTERKVSMYCQTIC